MPGIEDIAPLYLAICAVKCAYEFGHPNRRSGPEENLKYIACVADCAAPIDLVPDVPNDDDEEN